ncbi:MAG: hypothetical protein AABY15_03780 [Nanoarchaeota archaeon]
MKTQAATEYIMVVGFVIVILIPGIYLYVKYSSESQDSITNAKIDAISNEIIKASDQVYSYGEGSQTSVTVDFPESVVMVSFQGKEIVFTIINSKSGQSEIAKVANVDLIGSITIVPGTKKVNVKSLGNAVSVFVECNNGDFRCGTVFECDYYIGETYIEGQECEMTCENNKWRLNKACSQGPLRYEECVENKCVLEGQE